MGLNEIFKKIASIESEKTELGMHEVELANINDLVKMVTEAEKALLNFNALYQQIDQLKPKIVDSGKIITTLQEKINAQSMLFEKQFAELGLKFSDYPEYKRVIQFMSKSRMVGSMTASIKQL